MKLTDLCGEEQADPDYPGHKGQSARESGAAQPDGEQHGSEQEAGQSEQDRLTEQPGEIAQRRAR